MSIKAYQDIQNAKLAAKVFVMLYLTNPEFREYVDDSVKEMASQAVVLWNNREVVFKAVKEKVIEVADTVYKAACENLIITFEEASGLKRDEIGFIGFSVGYSIGNVVGFVAETVLIALVTEGVGLLAKAGKLGKVSKFVDLVLDASKALDPSELLDLLNPKKAKKILLEGFENASEAFKSVLNKLKKERDALFEVVEETKDLGSDIAYKLRNGTEIQIPKAKLTAEEIACSLDGCFTGDTLVLTKDGNRRIDEIKEGDFVYAKDVKTGQSEYKKVKYVYLKSTSKLIHLVAGDEEIRTTSTHLFFTDSGWWKAAKNIQVGERILTSNGELVIVTATSVELLEEPERIYNLNVEDYHTYFVGTNGLLVHNDCSEAMAKAFDDAVANASARGIQGEELVQIGKAAAEAIETILKAGVSLEDLARWGVKSDAGKAKLATFIKQGLDPKGDMYFYEWFNRSTFGFDELDNLGIITKSELNNFLFDAERFGNESLEHIFKGQVKKNSAGIYYLSGYHYEKYPNPVARIKTITGKPNIKGVYEAEVESLTGIPKADISTFFPKDWNPKQILDAISEAYWNRVPDVDGDWWIGVSNGISIKMALEKDSLGMYKIVTAFPVY